MASVKSNLIFDGDKLRSIIDKPPTDWDEKEILQFFELFINIPEWLRKFLDDGQFNGKTLFELLENDGLSQLDNYERTFLTKFLLSLQSYNKHFEKFIKGGFSIDIRTYSTGEESKKECIPEKDDNQSDEQNLKKEMELLYVNFIKPETMVDSGNSSPKNTKELGIDSDATETLKGAIFKEENQKFKNMESEEAYKVFERSLLKKPLLDQYDKKEEEEKKIDQKPLLKKPKVEDNPSLIIEYISEKKTDPPIDKNREVSNKGLRFIQSKFFSIKNSLNINDPQVNSKHAEIICENLVNADKTETKPERIFKLYDCGSLNGTFVRIFPDQKPEVLLSEGMVFEIGNYEFVMDEISDRGEKIIIRIVNLLNEKDVDRKCCILSPEHPRISIGNCYNYKNDDLYIYREDEEINKEETVVLTRDEIGITMKVKFPDSKVWLRVSEKNKGSKKEKKESGGFLIEEGLIFRIAAEFEFKVSAKKSI